MVRFDKPCVNVTHALNYFKMHMAGDDYLTEHGQAEMVWVGKDAALLGLHGTVQKDDFRKLCEGKHPVTGHKLGGRERGVKQRICYFGQISPPKDVSIAYLVGGDERIAQWWKDAVNDTVKEIEAVTATRIRIGKKRTEDQDRYTGGMVAAVVTHEASRALDPQLHSHICVMNKTYDHVEHQWKAVQPGNFYKYQSFFREVCYNKLAERLTEAGYELEEARKIGFEIKGFPSALRKQFSKRREEIESIAASKNVKDQDGLQEIAARSRKAKVQADGQSLRVQWRNEAGSHLDEVIAAIHGADGIAKSREHRSPQDAMDRAQAEVFERHSVINERVLLREALISGRADVGIEELRKEMGKRISHGELIRRDEQIVSRETLRMEREYLDWVLTYKRRHSDLGRVSNLDPELSKEQREAVATILFNRDQMVILEGKAGTGKTRTLREIVQGIEKNGNDVFACAPSSGATEVLRKDLTSKADTLQQLLINDDLQKRMRNKVIIVDEAGLISTEQMRDLCRVATENNNRIILTGDIGQHNSVQAGDALRALQTYGNVVTARLTKIRRQRDPAFRKAVSLLADKKAYQAFEAFARLGGVKEIPDSKMLMQMAVADYVKTIGQKKSCLVISPVWADIHRFTAQLRPELKTAGILAETERLVPTYQSYQWTEATRQDARRYKKGDVLAFHKESGGFRKGEYVVFEEQQGEKIVVHDEEGHRFAFNPSEVAGFDVGLSRSLPVSTGERLLIRANLKEHHLFNGNIVEVSQVEEDGSIILKDERILPPQFRQFSHGYATTSHAAQGKTVNRGIVLMASEGIQAANLKQAYVSHSRFEESHVTYTTDRRAAMNAMATPADRDLAVEVVNERIRRWKFCQKLTEKAEAWADRRRMAMSPRTAQRNSKSSKIYDSQTQKTAHSTRTGIH
jgi:conjugative relaxase-like TrwC/TraI family protein